MHKLARPKLCAFVCLCVYVTCFDTLIGNDVLSGWQSHEMIKYFQMYTNKNDLNYSNLMNVLLLFCRLTNIFKVTLLSICIPYLKKITFSNLQCIHTIIV